jgi:hypothetical protein
MCREHLRRLIPPFRNFITPRSTIAVRSRASTTVATIMSLVVEHDRYCGVPDWWAAVKRGDAGATIHPAMIGRSQMRRRSSWVVRRADAMSARSLHLGFNRDEGVPCAGHRGDRHAGFPPTGSGGWTPGPASKRRHSCELTRTRASETLKNCVFRGQRVISAS